MGERRRIYVVYSWFATAKTGMGSMTLDFTCADGAPSEFSFRYEQVEDFRKEVLRAVQADLPEATGVVLSNWIWLDPSPAPGGSHA